MGMLFSIIDVARYMGLEFEPHARNGCSVNVRCPYCGDRGYHMNLNARKDVYRCPRCGAGGGVMKLFCEMEMLVPATPQNMRKAYRELCSVAGAGNGPAIGTVYDDPPERRIASDARLDRVYTALLSLPEFALTADDRRKLAERGLSGDAIDENGYASLSGRDEDVGTAAAARLLCEGYDLSGVPGFYLLGGTPCFHIIRGTAVPVRNPEGLITALQIRRDDVRSKYVYVTSRDMEGGCGCRSRVHFTRNWKDAEGLYLTEGPLKSDVSACLLGDRGAFVAVPGVNSLSGLADAFIEIRRAGFPEMFLAYDMDRLTNPSVRDSLGKVKRLADDAGISLVPVFWDEEGAGRKEQYLRELCTSNGIALPRIPGSVHRRVRDLSSLLLGKGVAYDHHWEGCKGIDDWLLLKSRRKSNFNI